MPPIEGACACFGQCPRAAAIANDGRDKQINRSRAVGDVEHTGAALQREIARDGGLGICGIDCHIAV